MGMSRDEIYKKVQGVLVDALGVDEEEITPTSIIKDDLGAESIDFLDIMFRLEKEFDVKIPQREIERQARGDMPAEEFEVDGVLQPKGMARLKELIPEIDPAGWRPGLTLRELPALFTVAVFAGIVRRKLAEHVANPNTTTAAQVS